MIIDPSSATAHIKPEPEDGKRTTEEKLLPRFARPEYVTVYITAIYVVITGLTLQAIQKQADLMKSNLAEVQRQTDWLVEKERPRLSIELDCFEPHPTFGGDYCVTGVVSIYGHTIAKVRSAKICVSTEQFVVEDAFEPPIPNTEIRSLRWCPDQIELPRVIPPNGHDIRFSATVYSEPWKPASDAEINSALNRNRSKDDQSESSISSSSGLRVSVVPRFMNSYALFCRAFIKYSSGGKSWTEDLRMRFWIFGDPVVTPEYGQWEEYGEREQADEDTVR